MASFSNGSSVLDSISFSTRGTFIGNNDGDDDDGDDDDDEDDDDDDDNGDDDDEIDPVSSSTRDTFNGIVENFKYNFDTCNGEYDKADWKGSNTAIL